MIDFASELEAHRQRLIRSNYQALKAYHPKPYPGKVTLFRALNRPLLNTYDPEEGWQKLSPGRITVYSIPSSHEGMFKKPHVDAVAKYLKLCLNRSSTEPDWEYSWGMGVSGRCGLEQAAPQCQSGLVPAAGEPVPAIAGFPMSFLSSHPLSLMDLSAVFSNL